MKVKRIPTVEPTPYPTCPYKAEYVDALIAGKAGIPLEKQLQDWQEWRAECDRTIERKIKEAEDPVPNPKQKGPSRWDRLRKQLEGIIDDDCRIKGEPEPETSDGEPEAGD